MIDTRKTGIHIWNESIQYFEIKKDIHFLIQQLINRDNQMNHASFIFFYQIHSLKIFCFFAFFISFVLKSLLKQFLIRILFKLLRKQVFHVDTFQLCRECPRHYLLNWEYLKKMTVHRNLIDSQENEILAGIRIDLF